MLKSRVSSIKFLSCALIVTATVPLMLGGCPSPNTVLISSTNSATSPAPIAANTCLLPSAGFQTSFNAAAGRLVTVTITGPSDDSRPQAIVTDAQNNQVANSGQGPSSKSVQATFTPSAALTFTLTVEECVPGITGSYTVLVTQAI